MVHDWNTAVLLLPSTRIAHEYGVHRIGILPYYYFLLLKFSSTGSWAWLEDCRIITPFYFQKIHGHYHRIGRLPYYHFLLLELHEDIVVLDWKTAVLLLPFTRRGRLTTWTLIGRLPYYFLLLLRGASGSGEDWKTAVFILPFTLIGFVIP